MDSLWTKTDLERSTRLQIIQIYGLKFAYQRILTIKKVPVQQQLPGALDCGLYAVAYATEICYGKDPAVVNFQQSQMKSHLKQCLENGRITRFPQVQTLIKNRGLKPTRSILIHVELYCYCNMPEDYDDMIQCETCKEWFHQSCAGLQGMSKRQMQKLEWACKGCTGQSIPQQLGRPPEFLPRYPAKKHLRRKH